MTLPYRDRYRRSSRIGCGVPYIHTASSLGVETICCTGTEIVHVCFEPAV